MAFNRLVFSGILLSAALVGVSAHAKEFRLIWGHYLSNSQFLEVEREFIKAVEERTDHRVTLNVVHSGGLGAGNELLALTGRGAIDLGAIVPGYYADQLPYAKTLQIPFIFDSPEEAIRVAEYSYDEIPAFSEEMKALNVRRLFHQPLGSYYLAGPSNGCKSLDGLKGKKVRTFGADIPKMMSAVGAVSQSISAGDQYEALERGTLDYAFVNLGNIEAYRLYQPGPNICGPVLSISGHMVVIGERTWQRLPKNIQTILQEEASAAQQRYVEWVAASEEAAGKRIVEAGGTIINLSEEDLAAWKKATTDLLQGWVEEMKGRGQGEQAAAVAQKWRKLTTD